MTHFTRKSHMEGHNLALHLKKKQFKCELCDYKAVDFTNVKRHNETVHLKLRKFHCQLCKKSFTRSHHLKIHKLTKEHLEKSLDVQNM